MQCSCGEPGRGGGPELLPRNQISPGGRARRLNPNQVLRVEIWATIPHLRNPTLGS